VQTLQLVILFALFLLTVWLFFLNSRANHPSWAALEHRRYAHRGLHCSADSVPENSLAAFRRAIRHGYGAELDVHPAARRHARRFSRQRPKAHDRRDRRA